MTDGLTVELTVHFKQGTRGVKALVEGESKPAKAAPDRLPRISHLMALAILFLPPIRAGRDPITERDIRKIAAEMEWRKQKGYVEIEEPLTVPRPRARRKGGLAYFPASSNSPLCASHHWSQNQESLISLVRT